MLKDPILSSEIKPLLVNDDVLEYIHYTYLDLPRGACSMDDKGCQKTPSLRVSNSTGTGRSRYGSPDWPIAECSRLRTHWGLPWWVDPQSACHSAVATWFQKIRKVFVGLPQNHHFISGMKIFIGFAAMGFQMGGCCQQSVIIPYQTSVLNKTYFETELRFLMLEFPVKYEFVNHIHMLTSETELVGCFFATRFEQNAGQSRSFPQFVEKNTDQKTT